MKVSDPAPRTLENVPPELATRETVRSIHTTEAPRARPAHLPAASPAPIKRAPPPAPKQRWLLSLLILGALAGAGYYFYPRVQPYLFPDNGPKGPPPARIIPVVTAEVDRGNMDLFLNGLGTVTAFKTVTVRSRIEGELIKVAFTEGQMVREGNLLAEIDPRPYQVQLREAEAQLLKDKAALRLAKLDKQRYESLVSSKSVTQQQLDAQIALVQQSEAALLADQSSIDNSKLQLTYCHIIAPLSGRIGLRRVDQGNMVRANDPVGLALITQLQPIAVVFTIPQDDITPVQQKLAKGIKLSVDAFDRDFQTRLATGELAAVDNQIDVTTGTVRLKAVFENKDNLLFPNQFVNARLLVDTLHDVVQVPSSAVQRGPDFAFVYVVQSDSTVDLRTVEPGETVDDRTAINGGLEPGETVVIDGVDKLQKGTKVAARAQAATGEIRSQPQRKTGPAKGT